MTNEQAKVKEWMKSFEQECPEKPCVPSLEVRKLRAKLILEEALETCHALNMHPYLRRTHYEDDMLEEDSYGFWEDPKQQVELTLVADGCEDLKVVTEGTLVACGLCQEPKRVTMEELDKILAGDNSPRIALNKANSDPLFDEVMRSNFSKLWNDDEDKHDPNLTYTLVETHPEIDMSVYVAKDKDGKIIKSPSYSPANLQPIIEEMSKT